MPRESKHKAGKYSIYPNGYVYIGDKFKFILSDDRVFDYVYRSQNTKKHRDELEELLEGYPESFDFITQESLAKPFQGKVDLRPLIEESLGKDTRPLEKRLRDIADGQWHEKTFRDTAFAEALLLLLDRTGKVRIE